MAIQEAVVTSHYDKPFTDKHHGIEYTFEPGKKTQIPVKAAAHIFGQLPDRKPAWIRKGYTDKAKGEAFLDKFEVEIVNLVAESIDIEDVKTELDEAKAENESLKARLAELEGDKA